MTQFTMDEATRSTKAMLDAAIDARMPAMLVGAPGTGKTATVKQIAKDRGYKLITLVGSRMDPTDVAGLPKAASLGVDENDEPIEATVYLSPKWEVEILRHKKVILFLDEWSNSSGAVQAAFLTILQDREFPNGHAFPDETIVIGAMNPAEEAADGYEMALPTTNRIFWINWEPTVASWLDGMSSAWGADVSEEELRWKRKIVGFIKDNPTWLHQPPKDTETTEAYGMASKTASSMEVFRNAWASRRSWDNLSRVLAHAPEAVYVQDTISQGIVGFPATSAFREWLRQNDTISPHEVLADPQAVDWKNLSVNDANLVFRALIEMINEENALDVIRVFDACADAGRASFGGAFVKELFNKCVNDSFTAEAKAKHRAACAALAPKYTFKKKD